MSLTSIEIQKKEFKKKFRGFDENEVKSFLEIVAKEFSELNLQIKNMNEQIIEFEVQMRDFKMIEKTMQQAILQAHESSDKILNDARRESQNILNLAEEKKEVILDNARFEVKKAKDELNVIFTKKDAIISRLKILLSSELELISLLEKDDEDKIKLDLETGKENFPINEVLNNLKENKNAD